MTNGPNKTGTVLAAAIASNSDFMVTFNIHDFPPGHAYRSASKRSTPTTSCAGVPRFVDAIADQPAGNSG